MTEPIKETVVVLPSTSCKDCAWVASIKERQVDNVARIVVIEGILPIKVNWNQLKWILGGLCAAAILAIAANFTALSVVSANQHRLELNQVKLEANQEALKIKIDTLHKVEK